MARRSSMLLIAILTALAGLGKPVSASHVNLKIGWAVGKGGLILATRDGGETWTPQKSGVTVDLRSVWFIDQDKGFVAGDEGSILRTTNGGRTWQAGRYPVKARHTVIQFVDSRRGFVLTDKAHILQTTDGGEVWAPVALPGVNDVHGMSFADGETGLVVGAGGDKLDAPRAIRTDDGAKTWREITIEKPKPKPTGLASMLDSPPESCHLLAVSHGSRKCAWAVGQNLADQNRPYGSILATSDGGTTWKLQWGHRVTFLYTTAFISDKVGWVGGYAGSAARPLVLTTTDGGVSWKPRVPPGRDIVTGSFLADNLHGWVVGTKGFVAATNDFGATWTAQQSGTQETLFAIHFPQSRAILDGGEQGESEGLFVLRDLKPTLTGNQNRAFVEVKTVGKPGKPMVTFWKKDEPGFTLVTRQGGAMWGEKAGFRVQLNRASMQTEKVLFGAAHLAIEDDQFVGNLDYDGSQYTFLGEVRLMGHLFKSGQERPLVFKLVKDQGFVYVSGEGAVLTKDGQTIVLPFKPQPLWESVSKSNDIVQYAKYIKEPRGEHTAEIKALVDAFLKGKMGEAERHGKKVIHQAEAIPAGTGNGATLILDGGWVPRLGPVEYYSDPTDPLTIRFSEGHEYVKGKGVGVYEHKVYCFGF